MICNHDKIEYMLPSWHNHMKSQHPNPNPPNLSSSNRENTSNQGMGAVTDCTSTHERKHSPGAFPLMGSNAMRGCGHRPHKHP